MINLIIAIIAIAFTLILTVVGIIFLGSNADDHGGKAEFMKLFNESQQIAGIISIYKGDGNAITRNFELKDLQRDKYMSSIPNSEWQIAPYTLYTKVNAHTCYEANKELGKVFDLDSEDIYVHPEYPELAIPYCSKQGIDKATLCCFAAGDELDNWTTGR